ncbi:MAG: hypothetical protein O3C05_02040 [Proteobacteria bacterium]|nr:hypothetical protein [Pseudomonadota bacterium]
MNSSSFIVKISSSDGVNYNINNAESVILPGVMGDAMILKSHEKMLFELQNGICKIHIEGLEEVILYISKGYAVIENDECIITAYSIINATNIPIKQKIEVICNTLQSKIDSALNLTDLQKQNLYCFEFAKLSFYKYIMRCCF